MTPDEIAELPRTLAELPFFASGRYPTTELIGRSTVAGVLGTPGRELIEKVRDLSLGLSSLGMKSGDRVVLLAESRPEWLLTDLAILAAGAVTTPIYPTLSAEQMAFIVRDSGARMAVVSTPAQLAKILAAQATALEVIVLMDPGPDAPADARAVSLADVVARGHKQILDGWGVARTFHDAAKRVRPEDEATLIYTSGTTAEPKGVPLTHANIMANVSGVHQALDLREDDVALSFLPLCHAFERTVAYVYLARGISMVFAEAIETVERDLKIVRPTIMTGVPRVFEKLHDKILARGADRRGLERRVFDLSIKTALVRGERMSRGDALSLGWRLKSRLAERAVYAKVRDALGGRLRFAVSGGAALPVGIGRFFYGVGIPLLEGYGLTETSPVLCVMLPTAVRFGSVGRPLPNVELRIADDGEVLARGPSVMGGYFNRPAETAEALRDGWFHTGDIGTIDPDGFLHITDRKKELLVTSGGKKIAPQAIEAALRADPLVEEAVVIAERRHFPSVLIVPDMAALCHRFAAARPASRAEARTLLAEPRVIAAYQAVLDRTNATLAQFERLKKFVLVAEPFTVAGGELTPTLKVKRRVVDAKYRDVIEGLYRA